MIFKWNELFFCNRDWKWWIQHFANTLRGCILISIERSNLWWDWWNSTGHTCSSEECMYYLIWLICLFNFILERSNLSMYLTVSWYSCLQFRWYEHREVANGSEREHHRSRYVLLWSQDHRLGRLLHEYPYFWGCQIRV